MNRQQFVRSAAAVSGAAAFAPAIAAAQTQALTTVRFIGSPNEDLLPFWYAQTSGMFAKAGLNVDMTSASTGAVVTQAVVTGAADIGRSSPQAIISAHVHGIPLVIVMPGAIHRENVLGNAAIAVAPNSPFKTAGDLMGKTVAITAIGDVGYLGLRSIIDQAGGDSSTVKWIEMPIPSIAAAISQGRVDGGITTEPSMTRDLSAGKIRLLVDMLNGYKGTVVQNVYFAMKPYAQANPDVINRFTNVMRQASQYTSAHTAEMLPLLIKNTGMDPDDATKMHRMALAFDWNPSLVQPLIDIAAKYKQIPQTFDARDLYWTAK